MGPDPHHHPSRDAAPGLLALATGAMRCLTWDFATSAGSRKDWNRRGRCGDNTCRGDPLVGGVDMHAHSSAAAAVLGPPQVLVAANHLVYYCERDFKANGWRCGRCEVGIFVLAAGESLPRPGRTCGVCQAQVCLLNNAGDWRRRPSLVAAVVALVVTWPFLLLWALFG
jgi:hypothetical protein